jgi:hypothetical protein
MSSSKSYYSQLASLGGGSMTIFTGIIPNLNTFIHYVDQSNGIASDLFCYAMQMPNILCIFLAWSVGNGAPSANK